MNSILRSAAVLPTALFVGLVALYGATICPTVGPGDSGELTAVLVSWGVAHPPGFPLLSLLGNLVSLLPFPGEPALALNLMNAVFAALACSSLAVAVGAATRDRGAGFVAGLLLGTAPTFWEYALALEVFALNTLLAAALLALLARFLRGREDAEPAGWTIPAAVAVSMGVLTHHTTLVLVAIPVAAAFVLAPRPPRADRPGAERLPVRATIVAGLAALIPLLYLPIAASFDPPFAWGDPRSLPRLLGMLARLDFGAGTLTPPAFVANEILAHGESAAPDGMRQFVRLFTTLPATLGWPAVLLALPGLAWAVRRRGWAVFVVLFAAGVALFYSRVNAPWTPFYLSVVRPFALLPHLVLALLAGFGLAWLRGRAAARPAAGVALLIGGIAAATLPAAHLAREIDHRDRTFTREYGERFLAGLPEHAIVLGSGDDVRNTTLYAQLGLGRRPDVTMIDQSLLSRPWFVDQLRRRGGIRVPAGFAGTGVGSGAGLAALIEANRATRPVVTVGLHDPDAATRYAVLPMGLWSRVLPPTETPPVDAWAREFATVVAGWDTAGISRRMPMGEWELAIRRADAIALGTLRGVLDVAAALGPEVAVEVPALAATAAWTGGRRAAYLAEQAELWKRFLVDWRDRPTREQDSVFAGRAVALARTSLALDSTQVVALEALAAVMSAARELPGASRFADPFGEVEVRRRGFALRPGDPDVAHGYFSLVRSLESSADPRVSGIVARAEADRRRYRRVLELAYRVYSAPLLQERMREWDRPFGTRAS